MTTYVYPLGSTLCLAILSGWLASLLAEVEILVSAIYIVCNIFRLTMTVIWKVNKIRMRCSTCTSLYNLLLDAKILIE